MPVEKKCTKCDAYRTVEDFTTSKSSRDGLNTICRNCIAAYKKGYYNTPIGRAKRMWDDMNARAENADGKHRTYASIKITFTEVSWMTWAVPRLLSFFSSYPNDTPSIDRIDNKGDYSPENCRIISWHLHRKLKKQVKAERDLDRAKRYYESIAQQQSASNGILAGLLGSQPRTAAVLPGPVPRSYPTLPLPSGADTWSSW